MPIWRTTARNNPVRKTARTGSVLNVTRKNAALNAVRGSNNYGRATRAGINNAGAQKYYANMQAWRNGMPKHSPGQHQNNAAQEYRDWELSHPKPLLPGEAPDADLVLRMAERNARNEMNRNRAARESHGNFRGGRKSRKNRKSRKSRR